MIDIFDDLKLNKELTLEEKDFLQSCESKFLREFDVWAITVGTVTWIATRKLRRPFRIGLSLYAGTCFGLSVVQRDLYSRAEQILAMDGSILQKEFLKELSTKYQHDSIVKQLISKHFYQEIVLDDSTSNSPRMIMRPRNGFNEYIVHGHKTVDFDSSRGKSDNDTADRRTNLEAKHVFEKGGPVTMSGTDPFDSIFGYGAPVEKIHDDHQNKASGTHNLNRRRSHRRRRMRAHEHSVSDTEHAVAAD